MFDLSPQIGPSRWFTVIKMHSPSGWVFTEGDALDRDHRVLIVDDKYREDFRGLRLARVCADEMVVAGQFRPVVAGAEGLLRPVIAIVPYQSSNRVHFLFMTAIVSQDAELCWQPGNFSDSQPYVSDMPILLEIKTAFGPEDTAAMTAAFEEALKQLNVADHEAPIATSVAKKIVRLAKRGERNPTRLTEGVISSFRATRIPM